MNATVALEQQKWGEAPVDIGEWWEPFTNEREQRAWEDRLEDEYLDFLAEQERVALFDEERAPQYDDLAHYPATEREERAYQRAVDEFLEFGPWPE